LEVICGVEKETVAQVVARMLAERELSLGTIECGVDGVVSRRIFDAPDGPAVLGNSLIVDQVEEAIELLDLPRPQFRRAGDLSIKAARAAAREGQVFLDVDLCLAVWGPGPVADGPRGRRPIHVALAVGREVIAQSLPYQEAGEPAADWLVERALDMVRRALS
jgi:nicotinamide mononucleotide (NMN) deamidase PncC